MSNRWGSPQIVPGNGWSMDPKQGPARYPLLIAGHGESLPHFDAFIKTLDHSFDVRHAIAVNQTAAHFSTLEPGLRGLLLLRLSDTSIGEDTPQRNLEEQSLTLAITARFAVALLATAESQLYETQYLRISSARRRAVRMVMLHGWGNEFPKPAVSFSDFFENVQGNVMTSVRFDYQMNFITAQMQRAVMDAKTPVTQS